LVKHEFDPEIYASSLFVSFGLLINALIDVNTLIVVGVRPAKFFALISACEMHSNGSDPD
jgi:hypothetical protein